MITWAAWTAWSSGFERLRAGGMEVERVLGASCFITGSAPADALGSLRGVQCVASVGEQLRHRLPPPDAPVQ